MCSKLSKLCDHLVGEGEQLVWNREAERPGSLEVDDQLVFGRLHHWEIGWLSALKDFAGVDTSLAKRIRNIGSIADQAASCGPVTQIVDRGYRVAVGQRVDKVAARGEERIGRHDKCVDLLLGNSGEARVDFAVATGIDDKDM